MCFKTLCKLEILHAFTIIATVILSPLLQRKYKNKEKEFFKQSKNMYWGSCFLWVCKKKDKQYLRWKVFLHFYHTAAIWRHVKIFSVIEIKDLFRKIILIIILCWFFRKEISSYLDFVKKIMDLNYFSPKALTDKI